MNPLFNLKKPHKLFPKISLRTALIVPFILQIAGAVGLVGYFSFRNGQQAVEELAKQLIENVSFRIESHVLEYLNKSHQVLRLTDDQVKAGSLDLNNFTELERYFWNVVKEGDLESYLSYGNEQGEFIGVEHRETGEIQLKIRTIYSEPIREVYRLDETGNPAELLKQAEYDPRQRPWYLAAQNAKQPTWSPIYPFFSRRDTNTALGMSAVWPVFDADQTFQGVLCINITLLRITDFLKNLYISPQGQSFIVERSGDLVVSSTVKQPFSVEGKGEEAKVKRFSAFESEDKIIRMTTEAIIGKLGSFKGIQDSKQLNFQIDGVWYYSQILPIRDGRGLDWRVVVVVPETDFMAQIQQNTRITIGLCLVALAVATTISIFTARWITRPILHLNAAAQNMTKGELSQQVQVHGIQEVETLATSFNSMAAQLKESFETLEGKVRKRTAQLASANAEINLLNQQLKAENLRMSAELDILREMQQLILPKPEELAEIKGLEIAGFMEPADEVGGDYYDVLYLDGVVTIGIGDVTGHGLESGILMVMTQTAVRTLKEMEESDPVRFLDVLNRTIYHNVQRMNSDKNLTLAILNYSQGRISISGQHEETIIVRAGGEIERIDTIDLGLPIGLDENIVEFISHALIDLNSGDSVILYTDGITEAKSTQNKFYGLERLCTVVSENWQESAEVIKQAVIEDVKHFMGQQKQLDDITLLVLKQK